MRFLPRILLCCLSALPSLLHAEPYVEFGGEAVKAVNAFAVAHHRLQPPGNTLTSPWSIEANLAMVYAGAAGQTREAMRQALFFPDDERIHAGFQSLRNELPANPTTAGAPSFRTANRIYYDQSLPLLPDWTATMRSHHAAQLGALDFRHDFKDAEVAINRWVSEQTEAKIPGIIPRSTLNAQTRLVLVNAVYFDFPWEERFTKELTTDQPFRVRPTQAKTVPLMFKQHSLRYAKMDGFQIAALPYAGGAFQFVVFLPDAIDGIATVEKALSGELLTACTKLESSEVRLSFPRIRMEPPIVNLKGSLTALGAGAMFANADFSRLSTEPLFVSHVFHRAFLELGEDGTKAASATATILQPKNGHPRPIPHQVVKADHPFLFMIQHVPSGACIFLGRLSDPAPGTKTKTVAPFPSDIPGESPKK